MKIRVAALIFVVAFILQGTLLNVFSLFGVTPNLILCLLIVFTFFYENENAIYLALIVGIISDICFSNLVGISSLGYFITGFVIVKVRYMLNKENIISTIILGISGTILFNLLYWFFSNTFTNEFGFLYFLKLQPMAIITNLIVMSLLYVALINRVVKHRNDRYYR